MTEILLVRHGQSEWNAQGRWQGQADPPLSPLGLEQAAMAGDTLKGFDAFDAIASSHLNRAATTADVIADKLGFGEPPRYPDVSERDAGEWSGLTRDEIDKQYPGYLRKGKFPPGYEPDERLITRVRRGLCAIANDLEAERIVTVAHGGVVYCLEAAAGRRFKHLSNLGAIWVSVDGDEVTVGDRVELLSESGGKSTTPTAI